MSVKINVGVTYNGRNIKKSFADLNRLRREAQSTSVKIQALSAQMRLVGSAMTDVGRTLSRRVSVPLIAVGGYAVKTAMDFETSFAKIQGLVGVSADEIGALEEAARRLGPETGKSANEAAEALFFITSAGLRGAEAVEVLEASLKASAIGLGETAVVADLVTSATNAYGSAVLNATAATDTLTAAVRLGKLQPDDLAQSMGMVLPVASAMGVSFDQVGAAFAAMSRTGTDASTAATQLRQILATILNPTAEAREELDKYGLSAQGLRTQLRERGLLSVLQTLTSTLGLNDDAIARVFGNIRALSGVLDLMGSNAEATESIFRDMAGSAGILDEAFAITADTAQFKFNQSLAELKETLLDLGNDLMPVFEGILETVRGLVDRFQELSPDTQELVVRMGLLAAILGPMIITVGSLTTAVGGLSAALTFLMAHPAVLALAAIAGMAAALGLLNDGLTEEEERILETEGAIDRWRIAHEQAALGHTDFLDALREEATLSGIAQQEQALLTAGLAMQADVRARQGAVWAEHSAAMADDMALASQMMSVNARLEDAEAGVGAEVARTAEKTAHLTDELRGLLQMLNDTYVGLGDAEDALAEYAREVLASGKVTESTQREVEELAGALRGKLNRALDAAEQRLADANAAFAEYSSSIADGIRGGNTLADAAQRQSDAIRRLASAEEAYAAAQAEGDPERIAETKQELEDAQAAQGTFNEFLQQNVLTAEQFAAQVNRLREAGASLSVLQQITQLGAETGGRIIAELLAGGAEAIKQANALNAAVDAAATQAGNTAARKFYGAGVRAAQSLVDGLRSEMEQLDAILSEIIAKIEAAFAGVGGPPSAPSAPTPSSGGGTPNPTPPPAPTPLREQSSSARAMSNILGRAGFAEGGFVTGAEPIFGMLGEAGPEVVVPLDRMGDFGGPTIVNVTVTSADPQAVVEAIRRYTRQNGPLGGVVSL